MKMLTSSVVEPLLHGPLSTVQRNTCSPMVRPDTVAFGSFGSEMIPLPLTRVQVPTAGKIGEFPDNTVWSSGEHRL